MFGSRNWWPRKPTPHPDAIAVVDHGEAISYRQLETQASQLAHYLLSRGVGPERLVVLCLARSLASVMGR